MAKHGPKSAQSAMSMIENNGLYNVKTSRKKDPRDKSKLKTVGGSTAIQEKRVKGGPDGVQRKVLIRDKTQIDIECSVRNGEYGFNGKEVLTKVKLGHWHTYTFEMLIERFHSPRHFPKPYEYYDRKLREKVYVDLREKWDHRIGKNRIDK